MMGVLRGLRLGGGLRTTDGVFARGLMLRCRTMVVDGTSPVNSELKRTRGIRLFN